MGLTEIKSCTDVTADHIAAALAPARSLDEASPRERVLALLKTMARVATPGAGAPRMLLVIASMAKRDWVDGDLVVKLIGDPEVTVLDLFVHDGASSEKMAGPIRIDVPLDEFRQVITERGATLHPLKLAEKLDPRRIVLRGTREQGQQHRKASISALSVDFLKGAARDLLSGQATPAAPAEPPEAHPAPPGPRDKRR